jgi:hypothetical protein
MSVLTRARRTLHESQTAFEELDRKAAQSERVRVWVRMCGGLPPNISTSAYLGRGDAWGLMAYV